MPIHTGIIPVPERKRTSTNTVAEATVYVSHAFAHALICEYALVSGYKHMHFACATLR